MRQGLWVPLGAAGECVMGRCWPRPLAKSLRRNWPPTTPCGRAKGPCQGIQMFSEGRSMGSVLEPALEEGTVNDPEKG